MTERSGGSRVLVEVVSEGILLSRLQQDRTLPGVGAMLLDEFHERSMMVCCSWGGGDT
jgi:ATP-dependent helicase HrpB